jgi:hypothetical protein
VAKPIAIGKTPKSCAQPAKPTIIAQNVNEIKWFGLIALLTGPARR